MSSNLHLPSAAFSYVRNSDGKQLDLPCDDMKWRELKWQCQIAGMKKALSQTYARHYMTLIEDGHYDDVLTGLKELREAAENVRDAKECPEWILLTVNLDEKRASLQDLVKCVSKLVSKKWISESHYVFEQRGQDATELGRGAHAHILMKRIESKTKWSQIQRECRSSASKVCDASNPSILNFRKLFSPDDVKNTWNYLNGTKKDEDKHAAVSLNSTWRQQEGLQDRYDSCSPPLFLLGGEQLSSDLTEKNVELLQTTQIEEDAESPNSTEAYSRPDGQSGVVHSDCSERESIRSGPCTPHCGCEESDSASECGTEPLFEEYPDGRDVKSAYHSFELCRRKRSHNLKADYSIPSTEDDEGKGQQKFYADSAIDV